MIRTLVAQAIEVMGMSAVHTDIEDVSPGLGPSTTLRVTVGRADGETSVFYLKGPRTVDQGLKLRGASTIRLRERMSYAALSEMHIAGVRTPRFLTVDLDGQDWLIVEDEPAFRTESFDPESAHEALAKIRKFADTWHRCQGSVTIGRVPLERYGWTAYEHFVGEALINLDRLESGEFATLRDAMLLSLADIDELRLLLQRSRSTAAFGDRLPQGLLHGDFHLRNCRVVGQDLVLIDLEHMGVGPIGGDLATFVALYKLFGAEGDLEDEEAIQYFQEGSPAVSHQPVREAFSLWQCTWALHLRAGPGLSNLLRIIDNTASHSAFDSSEFLDIRDGLLRALRWGRVLENA